MPLTLLWPKHEGNVRKVLSRQPAAGRAAPGLTVAVGQAVSASDGH
ncbi:hypothetical protein [Streptomyces sp. NPDC006335]